MLSGVSGRRRQCLALLCLALQDRLEKVEKEVQSLKGENLALKLVLEEKKTLASVVKDGEVEVDSWKVVAASATKCTVKRHSAVDLNNRFSTLSDESEEGASNTTSATPSVSVERGSSADSEQEDARMRYIPLIPLRLHPKEVEPQRRPFWSCYTAGPRDMVSATKLSWPWMCYPSDKKHTSEAHDICTTHVLGCQHLSHHSLDPRVNTIIVTEPRDPPSVPDQRDYKKRLF
ncbi:hypothetical protein Hamer_G010037 [Homarus americanus]|uniref:Uncharacterized protein n=1 Tax=Homarus americanus TaxID=6706 RepID=A0A8J5JQ75_HOMAM|nr:hypothetical protein Hamer_G010037 [Homarus americanus]